MKEKSEDQNKKEKRRMNSRQLPALMMLIGAAISSIVAYINRYTLLEMLIAILVSMIIFWLIGIGLKWTFDSLNEKEKDAKEENKEGEVIEKDPTPNENASTEENGKVSEK